MSKIFSWHFIVIVHLALLSVFLLTGCAGYVSATVGDHTLNTGFHISHHEAKTDD